MIESVALILEAFIFIIALSNLFDRRLKISVYMVILAVVYLYIFSAINNEDYPAYISFFAYLAIIVYCLFVYKEKIKVTLINFFLSFIIVGLLQLTICIPIYYIYDKEKSIPSLNGLFINAISVIILFIIGNKIKFKKISDFIQERNWIIKITFAFIIVYVFANAFYMKMNNNIENTDLIQIIFFIILFFLAINEWQKAIIDAERKRTQLEMNELYYDAYDELILLIRERQHDMKSHINAILGMIYTIDNYDDLVESQKKYCDDVIGKNKETKLLLSIGNPLVAGFLFRKYQDAQKFEIEIECKVASKENNFFVPEYELIEMLGILIDNAIEALSIRTVHGKKIYVEIKDTNENLQILVANISQYYGPDEICQFFQKDYSSKGKGHGIGLHKLKKVVKEKDGDIMVTNEKIDENNYLQFSIILPKKGRHS